ncbi:hypothetical protein ACIQLJ_14230 [Microbacterium sp. NPDC091313]
MLIRSCASPAHSSRAAAPDGLYRVHGELVASNAWLDLEGYGVADLGPPPVSIPAVATDEDWDEWAVLADEVDAYGWDG